MRREHRLDSAIVLLAATAIMMLVPFAAAFGTATYTRLEQQDHAIHASLRPVPAILLEDADPDPETATPTRTPSATARWSAAGTHHTGIVPAPPESRADQTIIVWVEPNGTLPDTTRTDADNTIVAVTSAYGMWAIGAGTVLLAAIGAHRTLTRHQIEHWAREWDDFGRPPNDHGQRP